MTEEILINVTPQETRVAVTGSGVVQELLIERSASRGLVGNIYMGRVARVLPGMQSAFVEIGLERAAFLHVADIWKNRESGKPIEKIFSPLSGRRLSSARVLRKERFTLMTARSFSTSENNSDLVIPIFYFITSQYHDYPIGLPK